MKLQGISWLKSLCHTETPTRRPHIRGLPPGLADDSHSQNFSGNGIKDSAQNSRTVPIASGNTQNRYHQGQWNNNNFHIALNTWPPTTTSQATSLVPIRLRIRMGGSISTRNWATYYGLPGSTVKGSQTTKRQHLPQTLRK